MWYTAYRFRLPPTSGMWLVLFKLGHQGQQRYGPQSTQAEVHFLIYSNSFPPGLQFFFTHQRISKPKLRDQYPTLASDSNHSTSTEILFSKAFLSTPAY